MLDAKDLRIENLFKLNNPHYRPKENGSIVSVTSIDTNRNEMNEDCVYEPKVAVGLLVVDNNKFYENRFAQWIEYLEPIPLTEEWLLRFRFEQLNKQPIYFIEIGSNIDFKIKLGININGWFGICYDNLTFYGINESKIKYVHQLQNLYKALTQTELTLK